MRFDPRVLPPPGAAAEHALWHLKKEVECSRHFDLAKDIAAFANHFGGTILVGAKERYFGSEMFGIRPFTNEPSPAGS